MNETGFERRGHDERDSQLVAVRIYVVEQQKGAEIVRGPTPE